MTQGATLEQPRVEVLLAAVHGNLGLLRRRRALLANAGIDGDHLATPAATAAFALLGDHGRDRVVAELQAHWPALQAKGLAQGAIDSTPTPVLRLLAHALPHTRAVASIWDQMAAHDDLPRPPGSVWTCPHAIAGLWGQEASLHFTVFDVDYLLVQPDLVFGVQPRLIALDADARVTGSIRVPVDEGRVEIRIRHRDGRVFGHEVIFSVRGGE